MTDTTWPFTEKVVPVLGGKWEKGPKSKTGSQRQAGKTQSYAKLEVAIILKRKWGEEGGELEILTKSTMISFIFAGIGFIGGVCQRQGLLSSAQTFKKQQRKKNKTDTPSHAHARLKSRRRQYMYEEDYPYTLSSVWKSMTGREVQCYIQREGKQRGNWRKYHIKAVITNYADGQNLNC